VLTISVREGRDGARVKAEDERSEDQSPFSRETGWGWIDLEYRRDARERDATR